MTLFNEQELMEFISGQMSADRIEEFAKKCAEDTDTRNLASSGYSGQMQDRVRSGIDYRHYEPIFLVVPSIAVDYAIHVKKGRWPEAETAIAKDGWAASRYAAEVIGNRWKEAEAILVNEPSAAVYAEHMLGHRWSEAESAIATDGEFAAHYAINVIKGRWFEAENAIATTASAAYYAGIMLHGRWPEAEPAIIADAAGFSGSRSAYYYAEQVIKGRWPEVESEISKCSYMAYQYAKNILKRRWPECENHILSSYDPHSMAKYAVDFMDARWVEAEEWIGHLNGTDVCTYHYVKKFFGDWRPEAQKIMPEDAYRRYQAEQVVEEVAAVSVAAPSSGHTQNLDAHAELEQLIGLTRVKAELRKLAATASVQRRRKQQGLKTGTQTLHLVFTGNPGTGKTTVARLIGQIYADLGLLERGHMIEAAYSDLVADYVGQTSGKTLARIREAEGGVLFIDEAYKLAPPHSQLDFGREAIETLLVEMENRRDKIAVIVAGYPTEMERFLDTNPGLRSRFTRYISFEDYTPDEMVKIFEKLAAEQDYQLSPDAVSELRFRFVEALDRSKGHFGNGRYVRTLFERTVEQHSLRRADDLDLDLAVIDELDIPLE
ncbi:AAA family ATPase [Pararhizobium sp.]|uniref:AAA family ATPase n=1 Tax=Pararhizobium sp. TaxID=1977563 RepID=UPI00271EF423|nr:AAA family ATPase [Pararhizobium sp.]MDO9414529.1 AAA family ATPase [Pararhizobium sp.]